MTSGQQLNPAPKPKVPLLQVSLLLAILLCCKPYLPAQGILPPGMEEFFKAEDPEAFLNIPLGDSRAEIFMSGSWKSELALGFGFRFQEDQNGKLRSLARPLPGLESIPFRNTIDLLLAVWIEEEFFLEISFKDGFAQNNILGGFISQDPEFWLRRVWAGNRSIGVSREALLPSLLPEEGSPGILAEAKSSLGSHELFLRLDNASLVERYFLGMREVRMSRIDASRPIRAQYFILPFTFPEEEAAQVELWQEVDAGTGLWWTAGEGEKERGSYFRKLSPGRDYSLLPATGSLELRLPASGRLFFALPGAFGESLPEDYGALEFPDISDSIPPSFDRNNLVTFSPAQGEGFDVMLQKLDDWENSGNPLELPRGIERLIYTNCTESSALLLYEPGRFSPFEDLGHYRIPEGDSASFPQDEIIFLSYWPSAAATRFLDQNSGSIRLAAVASGDGQLRLRLPGGAQAWEERLPLESYLGGAGLEYLQNPAAGGSLELALYLGKADETELNLGPGISQDAIQVFREGKILSRASWTYDPQSGKLEIFPSPGLSELIKVSYPGPSLLGSGSALSLGSQHSLRIWEDPGSRLELNVALSGKLPLLPAEGEASGVSESPAFLEGILNLNFSSKAGTSFLSLEGGLRNENLLGARHLLSAYEQRRSPLPEMNRLLLAPVPVKSALEKALVSDSLSLPAINDIEFSDATRAAILWADSFPGDMGIDLPLVADSPLLPDPASIATTGFTETAGPYPVLGRGSIVQGPAYRADLLFNTESSWAGFQLPLSPPQDGEPQALSIALEGTTSTSLPNDTKHHVYLQLGALSEDLNADGGMHKGSPIPVGTTPRQQLSGHDWQREFNYGITRRPVTEDINGDGFLNRSDSLPSQTWYLGSLRGGVNGNSEIRQELGLDPALSRLIASGADGRDSPSPAILRLIFVRESGASSDPEGASILVGDISLIYPRLQVIAGSGDVSIDSRVQDPQGSVPSFFDTLPGGSPKFDPGHRIEWSASSLEEGGTIWSLGVDVSGAESYASMVLVFHHDGTPGLDLNLSGFPGGSLSIDLPEETGWYFLKLDFEAASWELEDSTGKIVDEGYAPVGRPAQSLGLSMVSQNATEQQIGAFHLYRISLTDPLTSASARLQLSNNYRWSQALKLGGFTIIGSPRLRADGFIDFSRIEESTRISGTLGLAILGFEIDASANLYPWSLLPVRQAGHLLALNIPVIASLQEGFTWIPGSSSPGSASSLLNLRLDLPASLGLATSLKVDRSSRSLSRGIEGVLGLGLANFSMELRAAHSQQHLGDLPDLSKYYFEEWLSQYAYLDPAPLSAQDGRSYQVGAGLEASILEEHGLSASWTASSSLVPETGQTLRTQQVLSWQFRNALGTSLEFAYQRTANLRLPFHPFSALASDLDRLASLVPELPGAWLSPPVLDFFLDYPGTGIPEVLPEEIQEFSSSPSISLLFKRLPLGNSSDLYLPDLARLEFLRQSYHRGLGPRDLSATSLLLGLAPINLFGSQGTLSRSKAFLSDQYRLDLQWRLLSVPEYFDRPMHGASLGLEGSFLGLMRNSIPGQGIGGIRPGTLKFGLKLFGNSGPLPGWGGSLSASYDWDTPLPDPPLNAPAFLKEAGWALFHRLSFRAGGSHALGSETESGNEWFDQNSRSFSQLGSAQLGASPWKADPSGINTQVDYSAVLEVGDYAYLRGTASIGWLASQHGAPAGEFIHHIGGRLALELELSI